MSKLQTMSAAIAAHVPDGCSVALGLQMEQMIPFSAGHEIIRQRKRGLTLIGPISDILFDQIIGAGCAEKVIAAWVGNVMMGSAYNYRRAAEVGNGNGGKPLEIVHMTNFAVALALEAGAMGVPFLPTRTGMGSDVVRGNPFFCEITAPFTGERLLAVRALAPDVAIVHLQRADVDGNAHCWGNYGVMVEASRAAKKVIVVAEEIVARDVIASDPNRTVIPGFMVTAVVESRLGAHPSPVQGCYARDSAFFQQYHEQSKTAADFTAWAQRWIYGVAGRAEYVKQLDARRVGELAVKDHAYAAQADFGY